MEYWSYLKGNDRIGPIDDDELARLKADGTIGPDTMVWRSMKGPEPAAPAEPPPTTPAAPPVTPPPGPPGASPAAVAAPQIEDPFEAEPVRPPLEITSTDVGVFAFFSRSWSLCRGQYWMLLGISTVGILLGSMVPLAVLLGPMLCGVYLCFLTRFGGRKVTFDMLFKGFDHFLPSFLVTLISVGIGMAIMLPMYIVMIVVAMSGMAASNGNETAMSIAMAVGILLFALVAIGFSVLMLPFQFAYPLIVDQGCGVGDSIKTAYRGAWANVLKLLGLAIVSMVIALFGVILCYVGTLFVLPFILAAWAYAYRCIFTPSAVPGRAADVTPTEA